MRRRKMSKHIKIFIIDEYIMAHIRRKAVDALAEHTALVIIHSIGLCDNS